MSLRNDSSCSIVLFKVSSDGLAVLSLRYNSNCSSVLFVKVNCNCSIVVIPFILLCGE